jgi:hypothetical protein
MPTIMLVATTMMTIVVVDIAVDVMVVTTRGTNECNDYSQSPFLARILDKNGVP